MNPDSYADGPGDHPSVVHYREYRRSGRKRHRAAIARSDHLSLYHRGTGRSIWPGMVDKLNEKRIGADRYPMVKGFRGWAHPDVAIEQIASGEPYPIKAAWIQTCNILGARRLE